MTGKIAPFRGMTPEQIHPLEIVSYELSDTFGRYTQERYNPDALASRQGLHIYSKMMIDEQVKAVMNFRLASITARGFEFHYDEESNLSEDERDERIEFFKFNVSNMRGSFQDALNSILKGHVYGFSLNEKVFDEVTFDGRPMLGLAALLYRDPSWFRFYTDKYGTLLKTEQWAGSDRVEVDLNKFIHYVRAPDEDRYYGASDLRAAYRSWYIKDVIIKLYSTYLERFAGGFAWAEMTSDAGISAGNPEYERLQTAMSNIRNLASLTLPPNVKLNVLQPGNTPEYREALTYMDLAIAKSVLVPNLLGLSHTGQTGAYSQSQTQLEAYFMTTAADAARLEDVINEQLFRNLGDLNWGDGDYPCFRFKPASAEHTKWLISTWKDLVGAHAVQTTTEDENHLRELLEMPTRTEEDEDPEAAIKSDPTAAYNGVQVTAMLEVLQAVSRGDVPKESAVQILLQAYPISVEEARALVAPIIEGSTKPEPVTAPNAPTPSTGKPSQQGEPEKSPAPTPDDDDEDERVLNTHHHRPRTVSQIVFTRATARVDFALIERQTNLLSMDATEQLARLAARAVRRLLTDEKLRELLDQDTQDIGELKFDGADIGKIKAGFKDALFRAYAQGQQSAARELGKAKEPVPQTFATLRNKAAEYIEANGFRMASNLSDGMRAIIQQELLRAVKGGELAETVAPRIYDRLIRKGFTTLDAVMREETRVETLEKLEAMLADALGTENVAAYLETLVRTNTFEAVNEARFAMFEDPALEGLIVAYEYSAILDDRTTEICESLDGSVYSNDSDVWNGSPRYVPPNHYNCRSLLIPIFSSDQWDGVESPQPSVEPQEGFK